MEESYLRRVLHLVSMKEFRGLILLVRARFSRNGYLDEVSNRKSNVFALVSDHNIRCLVIRKEDVIET